MGETQGQTRGPRLLRSHLRSSSVDTDQTLVLDIGRPLKKGLNGPILSLSVFDEGNVGSRNSQSMMVCLFLGKQEIVYSSFS